MTDPTPSPAFSRSPDAVSLQACLAQYWHDLRTPINTILGYAEILQEDLETRVSVSALEQLRMIQAGGLALLSQLNQILDAAGLETADNSLAQQFAKGTLTAKVQQVLAPTLQQIQALSASLQPLLPPPFEEDMAKLLQATQRLQVLMTEATAPPVSWQLTAPESAPAASPEAAPQAPGTFTHPDLESPLPAAIELLVQLPEAGAGPVTGRILLVDDNDHNQDILSRQLTRQGHTVAIATNGYQALEMLAHTPYDLILLDLVMPGLNGDEVLATLKQDPARRHIPVIMISALSEMDTVIHCISQGAEDYLTKPFNSTLLRARIHACLEKKRLREQEIAYLAQRLIAEATPVPIVIFLKADSCIVYANAAAIDCFCLPPALLQRHTLAALCPDHNSYQSLIETLEQAGQIQDRELRMQRLDDRYFWASVSLRPLTLNQQSLVLAAFWDITARKQAEAILRQNAARLKQELAALQVEINETRLQEEVSEVIDTEFFQQIKEKAALARRRHRQQRHL